MESIEALSVHPWLHYGLSMLVCFTATTGHHALLL